MSKVCRFYLNGTCNFGSSCRFLHSDPRNNDHYYNESKPRYNKNKNDQINQKNDKGYHRSYNQYKYQPEKNKSEQYYDDNYSQINENNDQGYHRGYNQYNYQPESKNKYISFKNDHYQQNKEYHYSNTGNINHTRRQHKDSNAYDYYSKNEYNVKIDNESSHDYNIKYIRKNFRDNNGLNSEFSNQPSSGSIQEFLTNFKTDFNSNGCNDNIRKKEKLLKVYQKEIKVYQSHIKEQLKSNLWPFTCFHPIGKVFPIQPIGSLNFIEISFEELRCDYYLIKTMCANPQLIHGQVFQELKLKAWNQKKDILSLNSQVQDDILETFEKCEQSTTELLFQNYILPDKNSYWDMSIKRLNTPEANKSELESFSFSTKCCQI
ncbi:Hypothetical protein CINCED_3A019269 [Cinara cedri]|uniref:C3H1-type domain-containing protein n=1 Tax=Cinara cedri TaxID=506608 RepID=A0A5E4N4E9_9HEMI|nr:Hypothetical protein CINCED_3A019269 [Cinara cedri]